MKRFVIAGGGTAGHVEPGIAVAGWLSRTYGVDCDIEFIGTSTGVEVDLVPRAGYRLHTITKAVLPRRISLQAIAFPIAYLRSISQAMKVVRNADVVIGFGGYVSASVRCLEASDSSNDRYTTSDGCRTNQPSVLLRASS